MTAPLPTFDAIVFDGVDTSVRTLLMDRDEVGFRLPLRIPTFSWTTGNRMHTGHLVLSTQPLDGMAVYNWVPLAVPVETVPTDLTLAGVA